MNVELVATAEAIFLELDLREMKYAKDEQQITSCFVFELIDGARTISINPKNAIQNPRCKQTSEGFERTDIQVHL